MTLNRKYDSKIKTNFFLKNPDMLYIQDLIPKTHFKHFSIFFLSSFPNSISLSLPPFTLSATITPPLQVTPPTMQGRRCIAWTANWLEQHHFRPVELISLLSSSSSLRFFSHLRWASFSSNIIVARQNHHLVASPYSNSILLASQPQQQPKLSNLALLLSALLAKSQETPSSITLVACKAFLAWPTAITTLQ